MGLFCGVLAIFSLARTHETTSSRDASVLVVPASLAAPIKDKVLLQDGKDIANHALVQTKGSKNHAKKDKKKKAQKAHEFSKEEIAQMNVDKRQVVSERQALNKEEDLLKITKKALEDEK